MKKFFFGLSWIIASMALLCNAMDRYPIIMIIGWILLVLGVAIAIRGAITIENTLAYLKTKIQELEKKIKESI